MKRWSRYNTLFKTKRHEWILHNTLSGVMLELDDYHAEKAVALRDCPDIGIMPENEPFAILLEKNGIVSEVDDEKEQLLELQYRRSAHNFASNKMQLSICPTLGCNFSCPYCFEHSQSEHAIMTEKTGRALIDFIKTHKEKGVEQISSIFWYGGEPLLAFGVIESLTDQIINIFPDYKHGVLVTNGYLLDNKKIDRLNKLRIVAIQITLDGMESMHNQRRMLRNGGNTYVQIMGNLDLLMQSDWKGRCIVRVNIDKMNRHEFATLRNELVKRYKSKRITVYPGRIGGQEWETHDCFSSHEWGRYILDLYQSGDIVPDNGFFPLTGKQNTCTATSKNSYVVGPMGELYKCLEDVGEITLTIGSVHEPGLITNRPLIARYCMGTDPFTDPDCFECKYLPVCGGGCAAERLKNQKSAHLKKNYCSPIKDNLEGYLEAHLRIKTRNALCDAVLGKAEFPSMKDGYRVVQPRHNAYERNNDSSIMPTENK